MSKHAALLVALVLAISLPITLDSHVSANPYFEERWADPPVIQLHSPSNGSLVNTCLLNFTISKPEWWVGTIGINGHNQSFDGADYELDGRFYGSVGNIDRNLTSPLNYVAYLTNLTDGAHTLKVHAYATGSVWETHGLWDYKVPVNSSSSVHFTLDATTPRVSILSLDNTTYHIANVTVSFTIDEPASSLSYSLDGSANSTLAGNMTLTELSYGVHNLTVYAWDAAGNVGKSETATFTITKQEPFPTLTVLVIIIAGVVLAGLGFLLYRKRGRGKPP